MNRQIKEECRHKKVKRQLLYILSTFLHLGINIEI